MDNDTMSSSGLSGWAWYQMGRSSAEDESSTRAMMNRLFNRRQSVVDVNAVLAENHAMQQEIAQLRQELADYERNYNNLRQWADDAWKRLKAYRSNEQG